ncbi:hypothetical protein Y032_0020g90 [Ancylostoma ceylanicum]|uniref:Fungal lipase-type domain-containing protein n=1 Tax=Ancylostoma ceylanicum TaxID=53326 RepID=A0A016V3G3_9BILA|nr:hypothetical protein Y032_0020g90 [Ancylostoma ceylanicum]
MSEPKRKLRAGGSVQHYFYVALEAVWKQMNAVVRKLRATYPKYSIMFTGHSLGGALASLASTIFAHRNPVLEDRIHLITFGQPRVGNFEYAETHNRLVPNSWRIVHKYDLVAHLPACVFQVFSRSCISLFNHSPYHHGTEVWFPSNMTENSVFRICEGTPMFEDNNCSNGYYLHYGVKDHIRYFEHEVEALSKITLPYQGACGAVVRGSLRTYTVDGSIAPLSTFTRNNSLQPVELRFSFFNSWRSVTLYAEF